MSTAESDADLLEALSQGDAGSLAVLYRRHGGKMLAFARRFVADQDAAEDVVIDLLRRWLERPPRVREAERLSGFLATSVYHAAVDWVRRDRAEQGRPPRADPPPDAQALATMSEVGKGIPREVLLARLNTALGQMSSEDRTLLEAHYAQALTTEECMALLSVSRAGLHQRLHRARERLARILTLDEGHE